MRRILDVEGDKEHRLILLNSKVVLEVATNVLSGIPQEIGDFIRENSGAPQPFTLKLGYEHLTVEEVLHKLLPGDVGEGRPSSYEQAGHIAHLNLRDEMLPYKHMIGQVILDKNPMLRTVVNKLGNIENEFRTFPMEVIAGQDDFDVTVRESGAKLAFNFRNVYWNSRLQTEHARLIEILKATAASRQQGSSLIVADIMAGVGPFAVPLAMHYEANIVLHANDLNPESYTALVKNSKVNRIQHGRLMAYNMDAREFIVGLVGKNIRFQEAIMNLPANATDFLDVFIGLETRYNRDRDPPLGTQDEFSLPRIHVYGFSTAADPVADLAARAASVMQCDVALLGLAAGGKSDDVSTSCRGHVVRDVSPKKLMICLSFVLPRAVACAVPIQFPFEVIAGISGSKRGGPELAAIPEIDKKFKA